MKNKPFYPLESNYKKVESLFGKQFLEASFEDVLKSKNVLEKNEELAEFVYGKEIYNLIKDKNLDKLSLKHDELLYSLYNKKISQDMDLDKIGAILVRPETLGNISTYKKFLKKIGLNIIFEKRMNLNFEQYWMLYHEGMVMGISHDDPLIDFPTRTFNYINNDCHLFIVTSEKLIESVSDYLFKYKGFHGNYSANTLRGDVTYNTLKPYVIDGKHLKKEANVPLDPIGVYRKLVRGEIPSDGAHLRVSLPILFYSGQGVHIPNRREIEKDLNVLCDSQEIKILSKKIR